MNPPDRDPIRIVFSGDSLTRRTGVLAATDPARRYELDASPSFVDPLMLRLLVSRPWVRFEFHNQGLSRRTSGELLQALRDEALALRPHILVVFVGQNDPRFSDPEAYPDNLAQIVEASAECVPSTIVLGVTPAPDDPKVDASLKQMSAHGRALSERSHVQFVPLYHLFEEVRRRNEALSPEIRLFNDGCHLSQVGSMMVAEAVFPVLSQCVDELVEQP